MQSSKKEDKQEARTEFAIPAERRGGEERWDSTPPKFPASPACDSNILVRQTWLPTCYHRLKTKPRINVPHPFVAVLYSQGQ